MHCGRTRTVHGFHPTKGTFMWSAPPRERAMLYILEDTVGRNDVLFPRCSAYVYEASYGFAVHTNCHDIQAEAQREYGLTPDDVHDSFNLFMCTGVDEDGHAFMTRQTTKPGDHVDLLALMDVLAVPNVCGADVMKTSNFALKPLKLTVFAATEADLAQVPKTPVLASQRTPKDFRNPTIKTDRPLRRDPAYRAGVSQHADPSSPNCRSRCRRTNSRCSTPSNAPTSMATMTPPRCATCCSPGGRSAFCRPMPAHHRSRKHDGRDCHIRGAHGVRKIIFCREAKSGFLSPARRDGKTSEGVRHERTWRPQQIARRRRHRAGSTAIARGRDPGRSGAADRAHRLYGRQGAAQSRHHGPGGVSGIFAARPVDGHQSGDHVPARRPGGRGFQAAPASTTRSGAASPSWSSTRTAIPTIPA